MSNQKQFLIIDLKSFYASVECVDRGLAPMTALLAVADKDRSKGTICLAMKALGIKNRCRIYEIPKRLDYIVAPPRMKRYIDISADIYGIYLSYVAKEDIHVYSIDESFLDVTDYLSMYSLSAHDLALKIMNDIKAKLGLRATCGIGTNLYLAKVALQMLLFFSNLIFVDDRIQNIFCLQVSKPFEMSLFSMLRNCIRILPLFKQKKFIIILQGQIITIFYVAFLCPAR